MKVCKIFRFDAAHFLPGYEGKCNAMHGHTWTLEVEAKGLAGKDGMVMDFALLKRYVCTSVIEVLDHTLLNNLVKMPTCENMLLWIAERLRKPNVLPPHDLTWNEVDMTTHTVFIGNVPVVRLKLSETPDSFAELDIPRHE